MCDPETVAGEAAAVMEHPESGTTQPLDLGLVNDQDTADAATATTTPLATAASEQEKLQANPNDNDDTTPSSTTAASSASSSESATPPLVDPNPGPTSKPLPAQQPLLQRTTTSSTTSPSVVVLQPVQDEQRIVESWIQQSLTARSATSPSPAVAVAAATTSADADADGDEGELQLESIFVDAGVPPPAAASSTAATTASAMGHRKHKSLGSPSFNWGDSSISWSSLAPPTHATSVGRKGDHGGSGANNNNSRSSHRHPFYTPDFEASWSNHSASGGGGESSASILDHQTPPPPPPSSHRPLAVGRAASSAAGSPRYDDAGGGGGGGAVSSGGMVGGISSVIHDAARITNWQTVLELCETQPEAAAYIGRDGWTALHHACNRRCPFPHVVEALIRAYPDALFVEEEKGWLPLHYACRFKAPTEVVRLLLHMFPDKGRFGVSRPDRKGRSPLYYAVRYDAPTGVVGLLLEVDASAVLEEDQNADSPLALVWDSWAEKMDGKRTLQRIIGNTMDENSNYQNVVASGTSTAALFERSLSLASADSGTSETDPLEKAKGVRRRLEGQSKVLDRWNKVNIFLKAAFGFALDDDWEFVDSTNSEEKKDSPSHGSLASARGRKWRVLHAVSAIKCHHSLFLLAAALHPEHTRELDEKDLKRIDNIHNKKSEDMCHWASNMSALHLACSSRASGESGKIVLMHLLAMNPAAAQSVDSEGSTPLHRIAENPKKASWTQDGVEEVHGANPAAVRVADANGQLPLHRAAKAITYPGGGVEDDTIRERSKICRLLQENEDAAHNADSTGCLPLHFIAKYGKSWDLQVQALYDANTAAVQARAGIKCANQLPLHMAAANSQADFSLVSKLVELNPRAASQADRKGKLPLHYACESGLSWKSIESIHNANPDAIQEPEANQRRWKALHMASFFGNADGELISNLTRLHPAAAGVADQQGRYPLHLACLSDKSWEGGLSALFDAYPEAIRSPDSTGLLPLHIMSIRYSPTPLAGPKPPGVIDMRTRKLSKSAAMEPEQPTEEELKAARQLGNLFNLIKADPTVLGIM